mmetsp:Transcript_31990/g.95807  ORF Transcript_31990/g.95807 Transcript_31990/m.95807 type:complete len:120 (-) Transcript_31990:519-878(-)
MRAVLITAARRATAVASRQVAAPQGVSIFQTFAARRPVDLSFRMQSSAPYAVDAPDGEHDKEDLEEHKKGVDDIVNFAASHEDADKINADHAAGAGKVFAVDAPDGEHDLEDVVRSVHC